MFDLDGTLPKSKRHFSSEMEATLARLLVVVDVAVISGVGFKPAPLVVG